MVDAGARQFDRLIAPLLPVMFRVAWRLAGNTSDAQDLVQDTCVTACENPAALASADHPVHWLLRVLHNRFIDGARRRRRSPLVAMDDAGAVAYMKDDAAGPEEMLHWDDSERQLECAFLQLEEAQRTLLALCAEGYDLPEIEFITGIGKEALCSRLYRARRRLAQELANQRGTKALKRTGRQP